ncbi:MAG: hypothetical protein JRF53_16770 [Deltaproteobacteria bacterium]|nr:hypothetical protein [Deltaproteobacteria bacterium]
MLAELTQKSSLYILLQKIDIDLTLRLRKQGCPYCGASLHQANYDRKPRGGPPDLPEKVCIRQSLCCSQEGCRRRLLPPSCLFMGRKVYWAMVILVVMTIRQNRPWGKNTIKLIRRFGMSRKTLFRWIAYYREVFPVSAQWKMLRGRIGISVTNRRLPGDLLDHFISYCRDGEKGLIRCLKFLAV